jgi:hypothetical protein
VRREGDSIHTQGTLKGKSFSRVSRIDTGPLYESAEKGGSSLCWYRPSDGTFLRSEAVHAG